MAKRIPKNKQVLNKLKKFYQGYKLVEAKFRHDVRKLEEQIQKEFKTPELEFIKIDNVIAGIGTPSNPKMMKVASFEELAKEV